MVKVVADLVRVADLNNPVVLVDVADAACIRADASSVGHDTSLPDSNHAPQFQFVDLS